MLICDAWLSIVLGLGSVGPSGARSSSEVRLEWSSPDGCPDADAVRRELEARSVSPSGAMVVRGAIERGESGFVLRLDIEREGRHDDRTLHAESCAAFAEAAGLLVAIAARAEAPPTGASTEPLVPPRAPEPEPKPLVAAPKHEQRPVAPPASPMPSEPVVAPRARVPIAALLRIDGVLQIFEVLPGTVSGMVGGAVGLRIASARIEARGRYGPSRRVVYDARPEVGGRIDLWTLGVAGCWGPSWRTLEVPLCGGFEAGLMRARSFGVLHNDAAQSPWLAATVDAALVWSPVRWLGLRLGPELAIAVRRPRFHVRDLPVVFRAAPVGLRWVLGIEARFP